MTIRIGLFTTLSNQDAAKKMAKELAIDFVTDPKTHHYDYLLVLNENYLGLQKISEKFKPFYIDFLSPKMIYRSKHAGLRKELLARAMGVSPDKHPVIIDATAGLGRDSFILASLGYEITMLERSAIVYALLKDALTRGKANDHIALILNRMTLIQTDSIKWLKEAHVKPRIVYLDPMFPERQKSASSKKEMVILQDLLGKDENSAELLNAALACATHRVVVKRPRLASNLSKIIPNFSLQGSSSRFDIYLV